MFHSLRLRLTELRERNSCFCQFNVDAIVFKMDLGVSIPFIVWMLLWRFT